ncbi:MAG: glyoxylate carboligase [Chloroflexi bacterium AL-W]|nr:glyoxylate carboligase [Chloroflexi bacterium AL-N1]NOK66681.1 glyoxylate carboligase [Chloroflexi bacterium AL-N10]NOK72069.1 glyoxylate carboligase [Chloroflexi bacterium AL-N5]NOK81326.1 glyoxylate carboligase [Chloroflexi bacterium AL-W]NOK89599.1 glyoxylate carboligase [Chloroflexi bacterium AL-N15]
MPRMKVMDAIVKLMENEGVTHVFGVPGAAILPLYDAMREAGTIEHLIVRHEEGGTHAADGYARATGNVGVSIGTSGPAGTNMITGLYTAMADSIPIICITGQAASPVLHKEAFQAVDIVEIAKPVTKWAVQVKEAAQMPWIFRKAFQIAREGRPGPILIDLPIDVQKQEIEYEPAFDEPLSVARPEPNNARIRKAVEMLIAAERPMILAGGGIILANAAPALAALAEYLQIPVTPTLMGKGAFPEDHPLYAGIVGIQTQQRFANAIFLESDCILAVGARFADRHTGAVDVYRSDRKFIHIDIEPTQLGKVFEPDLGIVADARLALQALLTQAQAMTPARQPHAWSERVQELKGSLQRRDDFDEVPIKAPRVFRELNQFFDPDTVFVTAIGLYQIWSGQFQTTYKPRHYMVCGQAGPLGWEVPACIGVKMAWPEKQIVGVVGDYSFQFLMEEVAVASQYRVPFVLVMINNCYMGLIRQAELPYQMNYQVELGYETHDGNDIGIDHCKVMEGLGGLARRVTEPGKIQEALAWAVQTSNDQRLPVLVEVITERVENAAMGPAINAIKEWHPLPEESATELVSA